MDCHRFDISAFQRDEKTAHDRHYVAILLRSQQMNHNTENHKNCFQKIKNISKLIYSVELVCSIRRLTVRNAPNFDSSVFFLSFVQRIRVRASRTLHSMDLSLNHVLFLCKFASKYNALPTSLV